LHTLCDLKKTCCNPHHVTSQSYIFPISVFSFLQFTMGMCRPGLGLGHVISRPIREATCQLFEEKSLTSLLQCESWVDPKHPKPRWNKGNCSQTQTPHQLILGTPQQQKFKLVDTLTDPTTLSRHRHKVGIPSQGEHPPCPIRMLRSETTTSKYINCSGLLLRHRLP
jgi:hypothetical protein